MVESAPFQKIVIPLDGSKWAEKAIPHAEQIARGSDGELILLHIYKPAGHQYLSDASLAGQQGHIDQARQNAENYVKGLRSEITSQNIRVSAHLIEGTDMAEMICNFVNAEDADVVVMTATSHNRLVQALVGDVTNRIAECCTACLLLVRGNLEAEWKREGGKLETPGAETAAPALSPEAARLLQQLQSLHEAGILNDAEFSAKRVTISQR